MTNLFVNRPLAKQLQRDRLPIDLLPKIRGRHQQEGSEDVRFLLHRPRRVAMVVEHLALTAAELRLPLTMAEVVAQLVGQCEVDAARYDDILVVRDAPVALLGVLSQ